MPRRFQGLFGSALIISFFGGLGTVAPSAAQTWVPVSNIPGGTVTCLAYDPATDAILAGTTWSVAYAGANAGAVYRSIDHGDSWTKVSADITAAALQNNRIRALAVGSSNRVFAGTDGAGIFRSTNNGLNWTIANTGLGSPFIRALAVDSAGTVYAATEASGVYISLNNGGTWSAANTGLTSFKLRCLTSGPGFMLVGTGDQGVFKRVGTGSWSPASIGLTNLGVNGLFRASTATLLAATDGGVFRSTDNGASWQPAPAPVANVMAVGLTQAGNTLLAGTVAGIFRSIDDGQNWSSSSTGYSPARSTTFSVDSGGRVFVGSPDGGVFRSVDNGQSWSETNNGLYAHTIHRLLMASDGTILAGTFNNGIYRSTDDGATWEPPRLATRYIFSLEESPWGDLFAGNYTIINGQPDGHAWRSQDHGQTWTPLDNGLIASMVSGFAFGPGQQVFCSSAWHPGGLSQMTNGVDIWTNLGPPAALPSDQIPGYFLGKAPNGDFYLGSEGKHVWRLPAAGPPWQDMDLHESQQFAVGFDSLGNVFVGNDRNLKGVCRSSDNGAAFQQLFNFPGNEGYSILVLPNDEIYASTQAYGIQRSLDHGDTWQPFNDGIPSTACFAIKLGPDGHLYAAGAGAGLFRSTAPVACVPIVSVQQMSPPSCPGSSAVLDASASGGGVGPLIYQWRKDGVALSDGPTGGGALISGAQTATLDLSNVSSADLGAYDCIVKNACGSTTSAGVSLNLCEPGDMNCNGSVGVEDVPLFAEALLGAIPYSGCNVTLADITGDSQIDGADIQSFVDAVMGS